jgi:hypothetical protein
MAYERKILKDHGYQDIIRDKLGIDSTTLPDTSIDRMDGVELAETIMIDRVPDYAYLTGNDLLYLKIATIYCVSAILSKDLGQGTLKAISIADIKYENFQQNMADKEKDLWEKVDEFLAKISTYTYENKTLVEFVGGTEDQDVSSATSGTSSPFN